MSIEAKVNSRYAVKIWGKLHAKRTATKRKPSAKPKAPMATKAKTLAIR